MELKDWFILAGFLVVLGGGYYWHRRRLFRAGQSWKKLGRRLGGRFESQGEGWIQEPFYKLHCSYQDQEITLDYYTTSTGNRSTSYWTRVAVDCPEDLEFKIYREGIMEKIGKQVGFQDIHIGHDAYDSMFIIKGRDETELKEILSPELRKRHLDLPRAELSAGEGRITAVLPGLVSEERECLALMELGALASIGTARA
jgi:hypothetical protein